MSFYKVSDCVHEEIVLPNYVQQVIETPQFQRLKNLKQLGELLVGMDDCDWN
jgi:HD superfamily phosphohydrolase